MTSASASWVEWLGAAGSILAGLSTIGLVLVAYFQIRSFKNESRRWETVKVCGQFITNERLFACRQAVYNRTRRDGNYSPDTMKDQSHQISTIFAYFEHIAMGISQDFYIEEIVRDNLELEIGIFCQRFLQPTYSDVLTPAAYQKTEALNRKWLAKPTHYHPSRSSGA